MSPKQARFVAEYLLDLNATQAAIRAGYSPGKDNRSAQVQGERLLSNAEVCAAVDEAMKKRAEDLGIDARYVLQTIKTTVERCAQIAPVLDRKGEPDFVQTANGDFAPAYQFDPSGVLKGAELLGRHLRMFTDKHELGATNGGALTVVIKKFGDA